LARRSVPKRLVSVYFDTPDRAFAEAGLTLRVRGDGERRIQTVKAADVGNPFERGEWEAPVDGDQPDLDAALATPLRKLLKREGVRGAVQPAFTVDVRRATELLREGGAEIELALDEGEVRTAERRARLLEVEFELKSGRPAQLFAAASRLFDAVPARLSIRNKAQAGYELLAEPPDAVKAAPVTLGRDMSTAEAFQTIGRACLGHFLHNERLVRERRTEESVHQARVAVRRLRAAMSLFGDLVADPQSQRLAHDLRGLAGALGAARDLDVILPRLCELDLAVGVMDPLLALLERRRRSAYDSAVDALAAPGAARLIFDTAAWLEAGDWLSSEAPEQVARRDRPVAAFAATELNRRHGKLRKGARRLRDLEPADRHRVRIRAKKVRYGAEFFAGLAEGKAGRTAVKAYLKTLRPLQDALGALNDVAVAERLMHDLAAEGGEAAWIAGAVAEEVARSEKKLLKTAEKAGAAFTAAEPFLA
jgi:inorganic triphosphatase YgiF